MYDRIGYRYDTTRRADPHITGQLARFVEVQGDVKYLDLASGTGNYSIALAGMKGRWTGVDVAPAMIERARQKSLEVQWAVAQAECLPFSSHSFSGAVCVLALHHFGNVFRVFQEVHRVLRAGKFVIFTADPDQMRGYWLNEYFPEAMRKSIEQMPSTEWAAECLIQAGFESIETAIYEVRDNLQDCFLYSGKHRPQLYLRKEIRAGISTFFSQAEPGEVHEGCVRLARDIESGRISDVMDQYRNPLGDYAFIIAAKDFQ